MMKLGVVRGFPPESQVASDFEPEYRIAGNRTERLAAFRLTYDRYLETELIQPRQHRLWVTPWHLLPTTNVFVATQGTKVICTVTLIGDGRLGLPMESIYSAEVEERRLRGLSFGEVSCLAFIPMPITKFLLVFTELTRLMAQHARAYGMHQFLIAVHPQHERFYRRVMGFERFGELRPYPSMADAPAVACCLDFAAVDRHHPKCYSTYFGKPLPAAVLAASPMSEKERSFFRPMVQAAAEERSGTVALT